MTPSLAIVRISNAHWRGINLWVPLFLLWLPLVVLSPLILIVLLAGSIAGGIPIGRAIAAFWAIACSLPGTTVNVDAQGNRVLVRIV